MDARYAITYILLITITYAVSGNLCADDRDFKFALTAMAVASTADLLTTQQAIERGAIEANPILHERLWLKVPITAATTWGMWELHKRKPKLAFALTIGIAGAYTALALHNHRVNK